MHTHTVIVVDFGADGNVILRKELFGGDIDAALECYRKLVKEHARDIEGGEFCVELICNIHNLKEV